MKIQISGSRTQKISQSPERSEGRLSISQVMSRFLFLFTPSPADCRNIRTRTINGSRMIGLMKKIQRQPTESTRKPPSSGPTASPTELTAA